MLFRNPQSEIRNRDGVDTLGLGGITYNEHGPIAQLEEPPAHNR